MSNKFYAVIMAGGQGTRLWPLSRRQKPKQLHCLMSEEPMIKDTYRRLRPVFDKDKIIISTVPEFVKDIGRILPEIPKKNYIVEPALMGNAAACGLVSELIYARDKDAIVFFMPADAFIADEKEFWRIIRFAQSTLKKHPRTIATIGIKPTKPDVNYGYIKVKTAVPLTGRASRPRALPVERFVEKPDPKTAQKYFKSGRYLWNAGIFGWHADHILSLFQKHMPKTHTRLETIRQSVGRKDFDAVLKEQYRQVENTSIDYGIIEKTKSISVIPADFGWSDVGSWGSLLEVLAKVRQSDSVLSGHHVGVDNCNCLVFGGEKLIATIGLSDIVVVDTPDATLICHRDQSHRVKEVLEQLEDRFK